MYGVGTGFFGGPLWGGVGSPKGDPRNFKGDDGGPTTDDGGPCAGCQLSDSVLSPPRSSQMASEGAP